MNLVKIPSFKMNSFQLWRGLPFVPLREVLDAFLSHESQAETKSGLPSTSRIRCVHALNQLSTTPTCTFVPSKQRNTNKKSR